MKRNEIIFLAIIIAAYLVCAVALQAQAFVHYIFIAVIVIILAASIPVKYRQKLENRQISKICTISAAIFLILYIICVISQTWYQKTVIDPAILLIPFFGLLVIGWFFRK